MILVNFNYIQIHFLKDAFFISQQLGFSFFDVMNSNYCLSVSIKVKNDQNFTLFQLSYNIVKKWRRL